MKKGTTFQSTGLRGWEQSSREISANRLREFRRMGKVSKKN